MHAGMVNQMMACAWIEAGREIESPESRDMASSDIMRKIRDIQQRPKPKFDF